MGVIEQLKKIVNWESALVLVVFFGCLTAIIIFGANQEIEILYIGGLVALGIPTSIFGNIAQRATTAVANNPTTKTKDLNQEIVKRLEVMETNIASVACEFANLRSQFEIIKINKEIEEIE